MRVGERVAAGSIGWLVWVDDAGVPHAERALPLVEDGDVVLALTYDRAEVARQVADRRLVGVVMDEPRNASPSWAPLAVTGVPRVAADPEGHHFSGGDLLDQELRRDPRARRYADSALLRREHWWYLPRLLVRVGSLVEGPAPAPRADLRDHLLVTARGGAPVVTGVRVDDARAASRGWSVTGGDPHPDPGPAVLAGQDATFPDLEQWETWTWSGRLGEGGLEVRHAPDRVGLPSVPGVAQRLRREWAFARACRAGLRAHTG